MAYAPSVNDRSGEILANASTNAAALQLQGMQSFANSMGNAMESLGEGYAKYQENKMTSDYLDKMADFYSTVKGPDGQTNLMTQDDLEKFSKMSLGAKQGMIAPRQAAYDQMLQNSYIDRQMSAYMQRAGYGAQLNNQVAPNEVPMTPPSSVDPSTTPPPPQGAPSFAAGINTRPAY